MKIVVAVKHVVDYNIVPRVKQDGSDVEIAGVKMGINPFDEIAVEEALRLKEKGIAKEIIAVSIGADNSKDTLRHALAMGADRAVLIQAEGALEPLGVARLLKAVIDREQPELILLGKQAIDDDAGQTGQMLAALLGVGQGLFASQITLNGNEVEVQREVEGGSELVALQLPAVVTADLRLNEPRFIKLPNMMMAKKKPIETLVAAELGVDYAPRLSLQKVAEPAPRKPGVLVNSVAELVEKLRIEKVLA
ncbi:electron transfer flavoprotein subunit beta/FixA family protein [Pseudomethylobacillus aquaticus]|uniref:Electron transfer flavoprotein subunit beta n=1 Tax=Pseudomethylobacillus aquaticus TaxID=2676064 RepID=A0A3N0V3I1_9PROT|nr:electron transfer flavoprotein subunit beta/FixA family protein [Pseudomethylobacillus aquaticus]ROH87028.1 electron transfer flavoprotein subunit beta/FixA family protein [Pseudomethylobacillus aquaticus]